MDSVYIEKSIEATGSIDSIDQKTGVVTGYFSVFGNVDSDNDVIVKGAYTKTLKEFARVRHLWQHNPGTPLAKPELKEDNKGLWFKSTISQTSYGKNVIQLYMDGVVDEHSIGAWPVRVNRKNDIREILEFKLFEGSTVTWGANSQALGTIAKSMKPADIIAKMDRVYKAIRNGKYEGDEMFELLDIHHKQLQQTLIDVLKHDPATATTVLDNAPAAATTAPVLAALRKAQMINNLQSLSNTFNNAY